MNQTQQQNDPSATVTAGEKGHAALLEALQYMASLPEAQIDVEILVDRFAYSGPRLRRSPIYWAWMLASPVFGLILIAGVANREPVTACLSALALTAVHTMRRQAEMLRQIRAALLNADLGPGWLGALIEALEWPDRRVQGVAVLLLPLMLRKYATDGPEKLSPEQHTCLYRRLTRRAVIANPALALAILETLALIGDEAALPALRGLAVMPGLSKDLRRIREAARAAQATIERRIAEQRLQVYSV